MSEWIREVERLVARRDELRAELADVEKQLTAIDSAIAKVLGRGGAPKPEPASTGQRPVARRSDQAEETSERVTERLAQYLASEGGREGRITAPALTDELTAKGWGVDQKQVSGALRNLSRNGRVVLVQAGGPRKPAIYALPEKGGAV